MKAIGIVRKLDAVRYKKYEKTIQDCIDMWVDDFYSVVINAGHIVSWVKEGDGYEKRSPY